MNSMISNSSSSINYSSSYGGADDNGASYSHNNERMLEDTLVNI
jgi:hypothetical protein